MKISKETYNISTNCQPVRSNLFVETSATSGLFRCASAFTVDASETRNPASVAENDDFVPTEIMLPYESVMTGAVTRIYVEGIGTSPTWGGDKIRVQVYPYGEGHGWVEDQVSYTVVRCVYKVCVYRPYVCLRNAAGAVTNRVVFRPDFTSPRTVFQSYFTGQKLFDDYLAEDFHRTAAYMGHAFARVEVRTPGMTEAFWTGQTGLDSEWQQLKSVSAFKAGHSWWFRSNDGSEDPPLRCEERYRNLYEDPVAGSLLTDPGGAAPPRKMVAVREFRVRPETAKMLNDYRSKLHPFGGYGLDTVLNTAKDSRAGCGSYIGLLTEYAGVCDTRSWVRDHNMPAIPLPGVTYTWAGLMLAFGSYSLWPHGNTKLRDYLTGVEAAAMPNFSGDPHSAHWGSDPPLAPYRRMRFCDPALMMDWIDQQNGATAWGTDRGVGIKWDVAPPASLDEWRGRP